MTAPNPAITHSKTAQYVVGNTQGGRGCDCLRLQAAENQTELACGCGVWCCCLCYLCCSCVRRAELLFCGKGSRTISCNPLTHPPARCMHVGRSGIPGAALIGRCCLAIVSTVLFNGNVSMSQLHSIGTNGPFGASWSSALATYCAWLCVASPVPDGTQIHVKLCRRSQQVASSIGIRPNEAVQCSKQQSCSAHQRAHATAYARRDTYLQV